MAEKPILFSTPMVQAILAGRKTMTRRVVKPQPRYPILPKLRTDGSIEKWTEFSIEPLADTTCGSPYGYCFKLPHQPGDRLYVKENTWIWRKKVRDGLTPTGKPKYRYISVGQHVVYQADHPAKPEYRIDDNPEHEWRLKVARYMPKWAARIWVTVINTRIERLQEITEEDAKAEGVALYLPTGLSYESYRGAFQHLWDSLNASRGFSWDSNPYVWVVEFRRVV